LELAGVMGQSSKSGPRESMRQRRLSRSMWRQGVRVTDSEIVAGWQVTGWQVRDSEAAS
jgi:hypothetical protein